MIMYHAIYTALNVTVFPCYTYTDGFPFVTIAYSLEYATAARST